MPRSRTSVIASSSESALGGGERRELADRVPHDEVGLDAAGADGRKHSQRVATSAGCWTAVSTSSSAAPWKQRRSRSSPDAALLRSKTSHASGTASAMSLPMPASIEPWPGEAKRDLAHPWRHLLRPLDHAEPHVSPAPIPVISTIRPSQPPVGGASASASGIDPEDVFP